MYDIPANYKKSTKEGTCSGTHERGGKNGARRGASIDGVQARSGLNGCAQESRLAVEPPPRVILAEVTPRWEATRGGLELAIRVVVGVIAWLVSPEEAVKLADYVEGRLIHAEGRRMVLQGTTDARLSSVAFVLSPSEAAMVVEEIHRALGALERGEIPDDDDRVDDEPPPVSVPPPRDTEPHPDPLELGRGAGGLVTLGEVCS